MRKTDKKATILARLLDSDSFKKKLVFLFRFLIFLLLNSKEIPAPTPNNRQLRFRAGASVLAFDFLLAFYYDYSRWQAGKEFGCRGFDDKEFPWSF